MNYIEGINRLLDVTPIDPSDVYYFESTPNELEFQKVYEFYRETLKLNSIYGFSQSHIFFINDRDRNAKASRFKDQYIVGINAGTIIFLIDQYHPGENDMVSMSTNLDTGTIGTDPNTLLYQFAIHFTFYHEMAHLIQKTDSFQSETTSLNSGDSLYSERNHLEELDADCFSSLCLAAHVIQLFDDNYGRKGNMEELQKLLIATCSAGINYVLSFAGMEDDLYFKEKKHPHPVIRISCVLNHILNYTQQFYGSVFTDEMRKNTRKRALELTSNVFSKEKVNRFLKMYSDGREEIIDYLKYFRTLELGDKSLASYKWNELIAKGL